MVEAETQPIFARVSEVGDDDLEYLMEAENFTRTPGGNDPDPALAPPCANPGFPAH